MDDTIRITIWGKSGILSAPPAPEVEGYEHFFTSHFGDRVTFTYRPAE